MDFNIVIFDVRLFYWIYLFGAILLSSTGIIYWQREAIKKHYFILRFPEKLIIINVIYPGGYIRKFYRLIPEDMTFDIEGGTYAFADQSILKKNDWFLYPGKQADELCCRVDGKEYNISEKLQLRSRWEQWPELYYLFGKPFPVDFSASSPDNIKFDSRDLEKLKKSTILTQIYASLPGDTIIYIVLVLLFVVLAAVGVILSKIMGWIK